MRYNNATFTMNGISLLYTQKQRVPAGSQKSGRSCWSLCRGGSGEGEGIPN